LIGARDIGETDSITISEGYFPTFGFDSEGKYNSEKDRDDSLNILKYGIFSEKEFYKYYNDYCRLNGEKKPLSSKYFRSEIAIVGFEKGKRIIRRNIKRGNGNYYLVFRPNMTEEQIQRVGTEEAFNFDTDNE